MVDPLNLSVQDNTIFIVGELDFDNSYTLLELGIAKIGELTAQYTNIKIDLRYVSRSDSSGLALLVNWLRFALSNKLTVNFYSIPDQLLRVSKICGLGEVVLNSQN